jgi:hypothetical protein
MYVEQEPVTDETSARQVSEQEKVERERMRVEVELAGEVLGYVEDGMFTFPFLAMFS